MTPSFLRLCSGLSCCPSLSSLLALLYAGGKNAVQSPLTAVLRVARPVMVFVAPWLAASGLFLRSFSLGLLSPGLQ